MTKLLLLTSVAGVALFAGAAQAADIPPVIVPVVVAPPVVVPGPVYRIEIDADIATGTGGGFGTGLTTAVDVRTASGFGFKLELAGALGFDGPPTEAEASVIGRLYHTVGANGTVGLVAATSAFWDLGSPIGPVGFALGLDADYETDALKVDAAVLAQFGAGVFQGVIAVLATELERGEHLRVETVAVATFGGMGGAFIGGVKLGYEIGPITPYVSVVGAFGGLTALGAAVGVELELPIGDSPLKLVADAGLGFGTMGFAGWEANIGLEYNRNDSPLTLRTNLSVDATGWEATAGIGVAFGGGRITGFANDVLENF